MKILFYVLALVALASTPAFAVFTPVATAPIGLDSTQISVTPAPAALSLDRESLEEKLGRKLTFKERLAVGVIKRKQRRAERRAKKGKRSKAADGTGYGNGMAIAGFVLSILALLFYPLCVLGLIFSLIGLSKANRQGRPHRGLAIAGIVISGILVALGLLVLLLLVLFMGFM